MRWMFICTMMSLVVTLGCNKNEQKQAKGPDNKELTLNAVSNQTITQGENNTVKVSVSRKNFNDPVEISFDNLPAGVTVTEKSKSIPKDSDSTNFTLAAAADAKPVTDHMVRVTANGGGIKTSPGEFKLTVKQK